MYHEQSYTTHLPIIAKAPGQTASYNMLIDCVISSKATMISNRGTNGKNGNGLCSRY